MATEVILPRVDMDMVEAKVAHWYVKDGETVRKGQLLFEIETDKAAMEVDAPAAGVMHGIHGEIGVPIPVGQVIAWILAPGEAAPGAGTASTVAASADAGPDDVVSAAELASAAATEVPETAVSATGAASAGRALLRATPLARSLAREHAVDLAGMAGSGPDGRVLARDLLETLAANRTPDVTAAARRHDLHLHWARRGPGVPLLLIHGFGADQGSWRPLLQHLPDAQAVVAIDLPNHGKSASRSIKTLQDLAGLVRDRLDSEGVTSFHLLGHSLGGGVALALAQAAPARVRSLTLLAPVGLGPDINVGFINSLVQADDEKALKAAMTALFHNPGALTGSFVATAFQQLQSPDKRAALAEMAQQLMPRGRQAQNLRGALDGLKVPVQLVWGIDDRIVPMHHALDAPAHVGLHFLPAVGHLPQVEAAALVGLLVTHQVHGLAEPA